MHNLEHAKDCAIVMTKASVKHLKSLKNLDIDDKISIQICASRGCFQAALKALLNISIKGSMTDIQKYDLVDKVMKLYDPTELRHEMIQIAFGGKK